jgi:hypothetical protein
MKQFNGVVSKAWVSIILVACLITLSTAVAVKAQDPDQITATDVAGDRLSFSQPSLSPLGKAGMPQMTGTQQATLPGIPGIDSVPNFSGQYSTAGFGPNGAPNDIWFFNTLGNPPAAGGTTALDAPIVPVSLDFRNANGSPRFVKVNPQGKAITCGNPTEPGCHRLFFDVNTAGSGGTTFLDRVLESPVFSIHDVHQQHGGNAICRRRSARRISGRPGRLAYLADTKREDDTNDGDQSRSDLWNREGKRGALQLPIRA